MAVTHYSIRTLLTKFQISVSAVCSSLHFYINPQCIDTLLFIRDSTALVITQAKSVFLSLIISRSFFQYYYVTGDPINAGSSTLKCITRDYLSHWIPLSYAALQFSPCVHTLSASTGYGAESVPAASESLATCYGELGYRRLTGLLHTKACLIPSPDILAPTPSRHLYCCCSCIERGIVAVIIGYRASTHSQLQATYS